MSTSGQQHSGWWGWPAALIIVAASVILAFWPFATREPRPANSPAQEFSAERALKHVEWIASAPRPSGSTHHARVRDYLLARLRELGLQAEVQQASAMRTWLDGVHVGANVENVVARIPGRDSSGAVLWVAHYDSVPTGPGAADNAAAVGAMLETARALLAGGTPRNDLILLFSDAEELELLGVDAFLANPRHPPFRLVLNFDARGSSGPVYLFETLGGSAWLMEQVVQAGAPVVATSVAADVYRHMPHSTDFSAFQGQEVEGLNFALLHGVVRYHTQEDDVAHLSPSSLQDFGDTMLALAHGFGAADLRERPEARAIYFNLGPTLVRYPEALAPVLALAAVCGLGLVLGAGVRRRHLRPLRLTTGLLAALAVLVGAAVATALVMLVLTLAADSVNAIPQGEPYHAWAYSLALAALVISLTTKAWTFCGRWASRPELGAGALVLLAGLALVTAFALPGASYLFVWPLLAGIPLLWGQVARADARPSAWMPVLRALSSAPTLLLLLPALYALNAAATLKAAPAPALLGALLLWLLSWQLVPDQVSRRFPVAALLLALVLGAIGLSLSRFGPTQPRPHSVRYMLDADGGNARWMSSDEHLDEWTKQLVGGARQCGFDAEHLAGFRYPVCEAPAPRVSLPPPTLKVVRDETTRESRTLELVVMSARSAPMLEVQVEPAEAIRSARFAGSQVSPQRLRPSAPWTDVVFQFWAPPTEGVPIELEVAPSQRLTVRVADLSFELPELPQVSPRPESLMPAPFGYALHEGTQVDRAVVIDPSLPRASDD